MARFGSSSMAEKPPIPSRPSRPSKQTASICLMGLVVLVLGHQTASLDNLTDQPSEVPQHSKVAHLSAFSDFQALFTGPQAGPSLVMACGFDRPNSPTKPCARLAEMMSNLTQEYPAVRLQLFYLNMSSQIDAEYFTHVRYHSDPQFLYVREGRLYYYAKATVSNSQLIEFVQYFDQNPDFMYRRLSDRPLGMMDNMLEGLYRILDKTQLIFGRYRPALYFVYGIFCCIGLMMLYAIYAIFEEAVTGKRYARLSEQLNQAEATRQTPVRTSEDLKVKKE